MKKRRISSREGVSDIPRRFSQKRLILFCAYTVITTFAASYVTFSLLVAKSPLLQKQLLDTSLIQSAHVPPIHINVDQHVSYSENDSNSKQPNDDATDSAGVIFHAARDTKKIAVTFDAEMTEGMRANFLSGRIPSSYNKQILDVLHQTNTKATIFLTGMWIELYPQVTRELAIDPLIELGSHSYADTSYSGDCYGLEKLPSALDIEDIGATEKLLREHAGIHNQLFRFPGGCYDTTDVKLVQQTNDLVVHWDVNSNDGFNNNSQQIIKNVTENVKNGSIIIFHLNGSPTAPKTAVVLPEILSTLKAKGFEFVKISELLNLPKEQILSK